MIKDTISKGPIYRNLSPRIAQALEFLAEQSVDGFEEKRVELDSKNLFVMYQTYDSETFLAHRYESHKNYIDIQYILGGTEVIRVADIEDLTVVQEYNPDKDIMFYEATDGGVDVKLKAGDFVILWPHDGHMPKLAWNTPETVRKIVVKIRL
ncbi:MAG: YhcH/YjgK/YiaL family protein [Spirochaetales bacterium]|nr:YhcH/YjgK/YiaL family protein [Spirochaetales bacterium]